MQYFVWIDAKIFKMINLSYIYNVGFYRDNCFLEQAYL